MSIEQDYDPQIAVKMLAELAQFHGQCHYDEIRRKIIYHQSHEAMQAYLRIQQDEMERHKWIESEKAQCDLGQQALSDWIRHHSKAFARYWRHTHVFVSDNNAHTD
jgi:hypothetical protein